MLTEEIRKKLEEACTAIRSLKDNRVLGANITFDFVSSRVTYEEILSDETFTITELAKVVPTPPAVTTEDGVH